MVKPGDDRITGCGSVGFFPNCNDTTIRKLKFLGGTVLSFNAQLGIGPTEESTLNVEIINDCAEDRGWMTIPEFDYFYGAARLGSPVFFDTGSEDIGVSGLKFGGILVNYTAQQGSNGLTFNAKVVDPRTLLDNVLLVVDTYLEGPIKDRNYFNLYAYYEYNILNPIDKTVPAHRNDLLLPKSLGKEKNIVPSGDALYADCSVYGTADSNERGMTYKKILQALNDMEPLVYSPNYAEEYNPNLQGKDIIAAAGRMNHEYNVFKLDVSGFPEPPPYYRVAGPTISILQLLSDICDVTGREFIVTLEENENKTDPPIIKIETKKIFRKKNPNNLIKPFIQSYDGKSIDLTYGQELRLDKTRKILLGDNQHTIAELDDINYFFGEYSDGSPIIAKSGEINNCGFDIEIELLDLNAQLNCPLKDYRPPHVDQLVIRKVRISETDLRSSLASFEFWRLRTFSPLVSGDFNTLMRYNFDSMIQASVTDALVSLGFAVSAAKDSIIPSGDPASNSTTNNKPEQKVRENKARSIADAFNNYCERSAAALKNDEIKDIETIYNYISNLTKTYYGKQYLVTMPSGICAMSGGIYVDNYSGINPNESVKTTGIDSELRCLHRLDIPPGSIFKAPQYTHVPTNDGGWADPCVAVLGLHEPSLSFFKTDDTRVAPFARFDNVDITIRHPGGYMSKPDDPEGMVPLEHAYPVAEFYDTNTDIVINPQIISGVCGNLDLKNMSPSDYLVFNENPTCYKVFNTGIVLSKPLPKISPSFSESDTTIFLKAEVLDKIYSISDQDLKGPGTLSTNKKSRAVIKFSNPCYKKLCYDSSFVVAKEVMLLLAESIGAVKDIIDKESGTKQTTDHHGNPKPHELICGALSNNPDAVAFLDNLSSALDVNSINSKGYMPVADKPNLVAIPIKSNINNYGPWYSNNFESSAGGIDFEKDPDINPWNYGSIQNMETMAGLIIQEAEVNQSEIETGSITYPGMPTLSLGFLDNGPNLTNVNVSFGSDGVTTNYAFQTYTPKFGGLKNIQNQQIKTTIKDRQKAQKLYKDVKIKQNAIERKIKGTSPGNEPTPTRNVLITQQASLQRIIMGEMYDFNLIRDKNGPVSGSIIGSGQRTVVGIDTLEKSILELTYDYDRKAFMSLDGLLSPISISGAKQSGSIASVLPMYSRYSPISGSYRNISIAPIPPVISSGNSGLFGGITQKYINPLTNHFGSGEHYHKGSGAGHSIDFLGRERVAPPSGIINSFYDQQNWDKRYSKDYRFLGLKGPLVLHAWGYDTQGKPIPNAADNLNSIKNSGIFASSGLKDEFLEDWLLKPSTWPVAPIDLRFDRERGVWVSPPQHKIVVAKATQNIQAYSSGNGILINEYNNNKYGQDIFDSSGNIIKASGDNNNAKIIIADRIGNNINTGDKAYAYFDAFSSQYLLLGGVGNNIKIGKFMNQWPSLNNVSDPANAVKTVHLYSPSGCAPFLGFESDSFCPWSLRPEMIDVTGTIRPNTVKALNLFQNVAAGEYQTKWCAIVNIGGYYYLLAAEC